MTSTNKDQEHLLKADELGRVRTPPARRQSLLLEFERSGLSGAKFAALAGIKYSTFANWLQKHRRAAATTATAAAQPIQTMRWLEAVVEQAQNPGASHSAGVVLELPGGVRVAISHVDQAVLAAALVRALASSPSTSSC